MTYEWTLVVDLGVIAGALALATLIRAKVRFFQKYLIPNALTAGFFLLLFYNLVAPAIGLGTGNLGGLVFHLLNISFISMSLKEGSMKGAGKRIFATAVSIISHYAIQVAIGLGITALFIISIKPDLFLNFGFFLALGYGLGPGEVLRHRQGMGTFRVRQRRQHRPDFRRHRLRPGVHRRGVADQPRTQARLGRRRHARRHRGEVDAHRSLRPQREGPRGRAPAHRHRGHRLDVVPPPPRVRRVPHRLPRAEARDLAPARLHGQHGQAAERHALGHLVRVRRGRRHAGEEDHEDAEDRAPPRRRQLQSDRGRLGGLHARRRGRRHLPRRGFAVLAAHRRGRHRRRCRHDVHLPLDVLAPLRRSPVRAGRSCSTAT